MQRYDWSQLTAAEQTQLMERPALTQRPELAANVRAIVERVRSTGDAALREYTTQFDRVTLDALCVSAEEMAAAHATVAPQALAALQRAHAQIEIFHRAQRPTPLDVTVAPGIRCERQFRAIDRVGLYVPAGSAPLPSTVLMLGVPAQIAGCATRVLCSPPRADGSIDPHILVAATFCGIDHIYKIGGAQAVAAMAYGTATIPKVDKIFGPGNAWVTAAKQLVAHDPAGAACDMPAGPSEVLVIADAQANPTFVAADLLSQAEHGPDSQVVLVTTDAALADRVAQAIDELLRTLPRREIAAQALINSLAIVVRDLDEALVVSNAYAPEHLIIQVRDPRALMPQVRNAGSVFLGAWSPESVGDYASGTNHVLPTYGFARAYSGLSVEAFGTQITFQELTADGLRDIGPTVETLAGVEQLDAHALAVRVRLAALRAGATP